MTLLVEIAYSYVSGVATKNFLYLSFVNWGTTGSCLIFTFYLSFWEPTSLGQIGKLLSEGTDENKFVSGIIF